MGVQRNNEQKVDPLNEVTRDLLSCQVQLTQGVAGSYVFNESLRFSFCTRTGLTTTDLQQIPDPCLYRWPVYGGLERETRFKGTRVSKLGQRSVEFQRRLREGLFADQNYTTVCHSFINPGYLPLRKLRITG